MKKLILSLGLATGLLAFANVARADDRYHGHDGHHDHGHYDHGHYHGSYGGDRSYYPGYPYAQPYAPYVTPYRAYPTYAPYGYSYAYPTYVQPGVSIGIVRPGVAVQFGVYP